jgi:hypothetical protein
MKSQPYNKNCPVIYDNDTVIDVFTDDYLMALASAEEIQLKGIVTSSSIAPYNKYVPEVDFESDFPPNPTRLNFVNNRAYGVKLARESGFRHIPDPIIGIKGHLEKPKSGQIEDTRAIDSAGSKLIVTEARKATPEIPLLVIMGGTLSVAANAYLLDPLIVDRMVIAWLGGTINNMGDYNGGADWWAAYIVAQRLQLVLFPNGLAEPQVPRKKLYDLPNRPYRQWLIEKKHPMQPIIEQDGDSQPAISLIRPDYISEMKQCSFSHWGENNGMDVPSKSIPYLKNNQNGNIIVITQADKTIGTNEWWRAISNPSAWH